MVLSQKQKILAWAMLIVCIAAIPVGLISKSSRTAERKISSKKFSPFSLLENHLLVLKLNGMIYEDDAMQLFPDISSPSYVKRQLRKAVTNNSIKGILLRINSPGGTVATSQELYDAIRAFRKKGKPLVVSMGDVAASGGYYIASAADRIVAEPGTLTGSIGVIMHLLNLKEIEKKIGIEPVTIKSGLYKDIGSPDRPMTKEERALLQSIIMDSYEQFVAAVAVGRKMSKETIKKLGDGRIYSGRQALSVNLIDELGGYEEALSALQKITKERLKIDKDLPVDDGTAPASFLGRLFDTPSAFSSTRFGHNSSLLKGLLPDSMDSAYLRQPLWVLQ